MAAPLVLGGIAVVDRGRTRWRYCSGKDWEAGWAGRGPHGSCWGRGGLPHAVGGCSAVGDTDPGALAGKAPRRTCSPCWPSCWWTTASSPRWPCECSKAVCVSPVPLRPLRLPHLSLGCQEWAWPPRAPGMGQRDALETLRATSAPLAIPVPPPEPPPTPSRTSAGRWWVSRPCGASRTWAAPSPSTSR